MKQTYNSWTQFSEYRETGKTVNRVYGPNNGYADRQKERQEIRIRLDGQVEICVDLDGLAKMLAPRALRAKGGKAVEAGGLVTARVLSKQVTSREEMPVRALTETESYL